MRCFLEGNGRGHIFRCPRHNLSGIRTHFLRGHRPYRLFGWQDSCASDLHLHRVGDGPMSDAYNVYYVK